MRFHIDKDKVCSYRHEFGLLHHLLYYFKHSESNVELSDVKDIIKWLWDNYQDHFYKKAKYKFKNSTKQKIEIDKTPVQILSIFRTNPNNKENLIEYPQKNRKDCIRGENEYEEIRVLISDLMEYEELQPPKKRLKIRH